MQKRTERIEISVGHALRESHLTSTNVVRFGTVEGDRSLRPGSAGEAEHHDRPREARSPARPTDPPYGVHRWPRRAYAIPAKPITLINGMVGGPSGPGFMIKVTAATHMIIAINAPA